jgi:allantoin racemase
MLMRLCVVHINAEKGSEPYTELIDGIFNRVKRPDTEVVHRWARLKRASDTVFAYPYMINAVDVVRCMVEASREGFDGAMVACSGDAGIAQARTLSDMPIVGPWEATLHLAASYAYKIGVVTVEDRGWAEVCDSLVTSNGLQSRCAGVRRIDIPSSQAFTRGFAEPEWVAAAIEKQARQLAEDGAGAITIGSAGLSCMASVAGLSQLADLGVPVFDTLSVGLKTLELRVDLGRTLGLPPIGRLGYMERLDDQSYDRVTRLFAN